MASTPFTQAFPLEKSVQDAFDLKVKLLEARAKGGQGSEEATYYFNARTPWIKMTSCVNLISDELREKFYSNGTPTQLAREYVLGTTKSGDAFAGHNYDTAYGVESDSYGIRPQPGITNMDVMSYNQYGSLRKATVNFQVWSKRDLDACEILYMRPGMSVLLEWGWSLYLSGDGTDGNPFRVNDMGSGLSSSVLDAKYKTMKEMLDAILQKQKSYTYNYDAVFGFVKNFSWSVRPDGGYDCVTELVTAGELVESFNMARPLTDSDVEAYDTIIGGVKSKLVTEQYKQGVRLAGGFKGLVGPDYVINADGKVYQEIMKQITGIPSVDTQTVLSAFISYDLHLLADILFEQGFTPDEQAKKKEPVDIRSIHAIANSKEFEATLLGKTFKPPISSRILETREEGKKEIEDDILRINWIDPTYAEDKDGNIVVNDEGTDGVVTAVYKPQMYIRYGLLLEILNSFMLQQGEVPVAPFDVNTKTPFTVIPNVTVSLDPSICLLPVEEALLRQAGLDKKDQEEVEVTSNIYDIRINTALIEDLIATTGLAKVSQQGVPELRIFNLLETLNTKINESTGNLLNIDIQYFEHLGLFGLVDRKTFAPEGRYYRLDVLGLKSLMYSTNITSTITPEMSGNIALSAQVKVKGAGSNASSFLRFNEGIEDRILTDRNLEGVVAKGKDTPYNEMENRDISEIFTLYELVYSKLIWAEANFPYVKNKFVEFVKELTGDSEKGLVGQVMVPFHANLTMDGMSGFRIMNGFTLDPKILPYKYQIKGGVGQVITGIQVTVDSTSWKTSLKGTFYNLDPGEVPIEVFIGGGFEQDFSVGNNYVHKYAEQLSALGPETYVPYQTRYAPRVQLGRSTEYFVIEGQYDQDKIKDMQWLINYHYKSFWKSGTVKEEEDAKKSVGTNRLPAESPTILENSTLFRYDTVSSAASALQQYWINRSSGFAENEAWQNHERYPWSAVYVSFMLSKIDLAGKVDHISQLYLGGYGSSEWYKNTSSHWGYTTKAKQSREGSKKGGLWVAFALRDLNAELRASEGDEPVSLRPSPPQNIRILAQPGDVLVKPRSGAYTNSHGAIVAYVGDKFNSYGVASEIPVDKIPESDGELMIAHGNMGNTNRLERKDSFIGKDNCYVPDNPEGYLIVLKRFE